MNTLVLSDLLQVSVIPIFIYTIVSSRVGTPPFLGEPPLFEANLKSYPLFLRAIQIGTCKL